MEQRRFTSELEANRFTVTKVLDLARAGALRVPPFQRPLRWRRPDHQMLLDSLYRGYPVGTLLLWQRDAPADEVIFGRTVIPAPSMSDAYWIVDGQQRITSIVGSLLDVASTVTQRPGAFAFYFDLENDQFIPVKGPAHPGLVPVHRLSDPVATSMWAQEVGASNDLHKQAQTVGARLRGYEIPAYITRTQSDDVLRTIFLRANTAGKRMRQEEVFEALHKGVRSGESPDSLTERLRAALFALEFGPVRDRDLQLSLVSVAGYNPKERLPDALRVPGAALRWESPTLEALRRTVQFLRDEAGIPHARAMPYALPLILLPRFFHLQSEPCERSIELLVRWVWRGIASQRHAATNQQFNPAYQILKSQGEEQIVQGLLQMVPSVRPASLPQSTVFNPRGMTTMMELAVLFSLGPLSLEDGHPLEAVEVFEASGAPERPEREDGEPSPSLFDSSGPEAEEEEEEAELVTPPSSPGRATAPLDLAVLPVASKRLERLVAARLLHPPVHGGAGRLLDLLQRASPAVRASHAIGPDLDEAVARGDWDRVVEGRAQALHLLTRLTIDRRARWGEDDDGPSLESLRDDPSELE